MLVFSPTLDEMAQVEAILLAHLREGSPPSPNPLTEGLAWGAICHLLDGLWHGEDPQPTLARIDPFDPRGQRPRLVPPEVGAVLVSLHALLSAPLEVRQQRRHVQAWLRRNLDAVTATVPAYPEEAGGSSAAVLDRALVLEVARARHEGRIPRLAGFLRPPQPGYSPREAPASGGLTLLETVGLLELPRELAEDLDVDVVLPEVRLRGLER